MVSTAGASGADTTANQDSGRSRAFSAGRPSRQAVAEKAPSEAGRAVPAPRAPVGVLERPADRPSATYPPPTVTADGPSPGDELVRLIVEQLSPLLGLDAARVSFGI